MRKVLSLVLVALFLLSGCSNNEAPVSTSAFQDSQQTSLTQEQSEALDNYILVREEAVKTKDENAFLSLFNLSDTFYTNEQKAWFTDRKKQDITDYNLDIVSTSFIDEYSFSAALKETFLLKGNKRSYTYDLVFERFEDEYKEIGTNMELLELDNFNIYYDTIAKEYAEQIKELYSTKTKSLYSFFDYTPSLIGQARVYGNMTTMQGTIKPSTPDWVAGWSEYKQSIKIARYNNVDFSDIKEYIDQTILHEQIHAMLSDLSNDNLNYFMQEGFATLFSSDTYELTKSEKFSLKALYKNNYSLLDLKTLEDTHLEDLSAPHSNNYYLICKAYGYIIYKDHDISGIKSLLSELKNHEYIELTSDDKLSTINELTNSALKSALDEDITSLTNKLKDYINSLD